MCYKLHIVPQIGDCFMKTLYNNLELTFQSERKGQVIKVSSRDSRDSGVVSVYIKDNIIRSLSGTLKLTPSSEVKAAAQKVIAGHLQ